MLHIFCAICLLLPLTLAAAPSQTHSGAYNPCQLGWKRLVFSGEKFLGNVTVAVEMAFVSAQDAKRVLIASPRGIPVSVDSPSVGHLTIRRIIDSTFRSQITEVDRVWFDATRASALGRMRIRRGDDDFLKIYRFTDLGVFRIQKEPANIDELKLAPDKWTAIGENFYSHDLKKLACSVASERSILLYAAALARFPNNGKPLTLCVFGKRQLHRVRLRLSGRQILRVRYIEKKENAEAFRAVTIDAMKVTLAAQPLESDLPEIENFSFLGLHQNITIFIDPVLRMPVQISGELPKLGSIDFRLTEVQLK